MNDAFAQLVTPILIHGTDLQRRIEEGDQLGLSEVKAELLGLFAGSESRAGASRELAAEFALAKSALVYWLDEVLIDSRWAHAPDWKNNILEWDYYRERLGGEKFYDKAEEAIRLSGVDPLETFYLCVALGFSGKYAFAKPDLQEWAERAYARITSGTSPAERFLPDEPRRSDRLAPLPGKGLLLTVSGLVAGTMLLTLLGFILTVHLTAD